ncbi:mucin-2-like [Hippoglossus stenolepis]|uniref:mucin-2-like n=1 Tax=Hippoglossus stenolepis TaxID=195615 RepID=UPI001FAF91AB|nr:mucin-2-like [Hippoglossus stenolepis]
MAMTILRVLLCAVFMVTAVMSKPVNLSEGGGSSKSSESNESNESVETATHVEPSQDPLQTAFTETDIPPAGEETDPAGTAGLLPSADSGASPATLDTSALPSEDPQTFTDASQLVPGDPSQAAHGTDIPPDPAQDTVHATEVSPQPEITATGIFMGICGTTEPEVISATTAYQGFPQGATPPFPPHINPTNSPSSTTPSLLVPVSVAMTAGTVCFTLQFREPDPPRGDSI